MASLRFAGLLLGFLLVFQGPNYARGIKKDEVVYGISATEFGKRGQLGGRKMAVMEKELNGEGQKNGESTSTPNKTTGLSDTRLELEEGCNINKDESQSRPQSSNNSTNPQSKTGLSTEASLELEGSSKSNTNKQERQRLLEEANEKVMQLMRKDYGGMSKPRRRKPPA